MSVRPINLLLVTWSTVALLSALSHLFAPAWTAAGTVWATSAGWQREVAYFNVLVSGAFLGAARSKDIQLKLAATLAITALSTVLGFHHLQGWITEPRHFHVVFTLGNFFASLWAMGCLVYANRQRLRA